jgi:hypothetical protein
MESTALLPADELQHHAEEIGPRELHTEAGGEAHLSVGDGPEAWGWAVATGVLRGLSYFFWRRLQATRASA